MDRLFSPAFIDYVGTFLLYTIACLFVIKVFTPDQVQDRLRNLFSGPVTWFHKHIA